MTPPRTERPLKPGKGVSVELTPGLSDWLSLSMAAVYGAVMAIQEAPDPDKALRLLSMAWDLPIDRDRQWGDRVTRRVKHQRGEVRLAVVARHGKLRLDIREFYRD
jgi:hypothetical protein